MEAWKPFNVVIDIPVSRAIPDEFWAIDLLLLSIVQGKQL